MSDDRDDLVPVSFAYEYARHGWAHASISDGLTSYEMAPSYVPIDPRFELIHTVVHALRYGGEASCAWFYEPAMDRWMLRRVGDILHITIRAVSDGFSRPNWSFEQGELRFAATCDLWKFAAKLRLAASRLAPAAETYYDPSSVQRTGEYRSLRALLDEHSRAQRGTRGHRLA